MATTKNQAQTPYHSKSLRQKVCEAWVFSEQGYPDFPQDKQGKKLYEVKHLYLHIEKSLKILAKHPEKLAREKNTLMFDYGKREERTMNEIAFLKLFKSFLMLTTVNERYEHKRGVANIIPRAQIYEKIVGGHMTMYDIFFDLSLELNIMIEKGDHTGQIPIYELELLIFNVNHYIDVYLDHHGVPFPGAKVLQV